MIGDSGRTPGADMVHGDLPDVGRHCLTKVPAGQVETGPPARQEHPASHLRSGRGPSQPLVRKPAFPSARTRTRWGGSAEQVVVASRLLGNRSEEHTSELQSLMRISYAV